MAYNPYMTYDIHRIRLERFGGPMIKPRCYAMSGGDRCEYHIHNGAGHAAQTGSHQWTEQPLGYCTSCGEAQYPLGVTLVGGQGDTVYAPRCCDAALVQRPKALR